MPQHHAKPAGFALPAVLIVVVAMLILVIALLLVTGIERQTARSFVDFERANLAVRAGFEEMQDVLLAEAMNDDFVVLGATRGQPLREGRLDTPYLFIARAEDDSGSGEIRYEPLFSHHQKPSSDSRFAAPGVESLTDDGDGGFIDFSTLPYQDNTRASWVYLADDNGRNVSRYAWFVEDMQGRLDASKAGNLEGSGGTHARAVYPFPAPGIPAGDEAADMPAISAAALYAVDPDATTADQRDLANRIIGNRNLMVSPGSMLAVAEAPTPLQRDPFSGRLLDHALRAVEESLAANNQPYFERPVVPFANGIAPSAIGAPKINLNEMLQKSPSRAVSDMATHIREALPEFDSRKGGFPEDYIKTLSANTLVYASKSNTPVMSLGEYRGVGPYPLVSEFLKRYRWNNIFVEEGRKYVEFTVTTYVELWNMTNKRVRGEAQITYETEARFPLGPIPEVSLADLEDAEHELTFSDGYYWHPALNKDRGDTPATDDDNDDNDEPIFHFIITLEPNEYHLFNCGTVTYRFDVGNADVWIPSPLVFEGETFGSSNAGYRMRWNGVIVDQSGGGIHRNNSSINYPLDTMDRPRQRVRTTVPAHSHTRGGSFVNNMGDPRMSWYLDAPQDANSYPNNYSPNRRNIRRGTIYDSDAAAKPKVYGRVLPSEWPDGGHNSPYATGNPFTTTDQRVNPDDPRFFNNLPALIPDDSPHRLSRSGRFYSATELGNVFDPIMWQPTFPNAAQTMEIRRGFMPSGRDRWPDVHPTSPASPDFGGGNTLRIGRPEHPAFDPPGDRSRHAVRLLDLFHAGIPQSESRDEREGPLVRIDGHVNLNTAGRDALRALAAGRIGQDPRLSRRLSANHITTNFFSPRVQAINLEAPHDDSLADRVADAILAARPFASAADAVFAKTPDGEHVFGNRAQYAQNDTIHWSDAAAEELFARVYNNATVRSRNFRVWVVGQSLARKTGTAATAEVLAETRKVFTIHADPGERAGDGSVIPSNPRIQILHESDF